MSEVSSSLYAGRVEGSWVTFNNALHLIQQSKSINRLTFANKLCGNGNNRHGFCHCIIDAFRIKLRDGCFDLLKVIKFFRVVHTFIPHKYAI
jgi:hypothetical protein